MNSLVPSLLIGLSLFAVWESFVLIWKTFPYNIPVTLRPILFVGGGVLLAFTTNSHYHGWLITTIVGLAGAGIAKLCNIFYQLVLAAGEARALDIISRANTRMRAERSSNSGVGNRVNLPS